MKVPCDHNMTTFSHIFTDFSALQKGLQLGIHPSQPLSPEEAQLKPVSQIEKVTQAEGISCQCSSTREDICQHDSITPGWWGKQHIATVPAKLLSVEQACCFSSHNIMIHGMSALLNIWHEIQSCGIFVLLILTIPEPRHLICKWSIHPNHTALPW